MKLSEQWLRSWLPEAVHLSTQELVSALTDLGLEVDDCHPDEIETEDFIYTLKTPANRGDCFGVWGVVRELSARFAMNYVVPFTLEPMVVLQKKATTALTVDVEGAAQQACPLYHAAVMVGIRNDAVTPAWMSARLRKSGIRSHFPVVDIVNYVMLECGQPMHAFDRQQLVGHLQVRQSKPSETLTVLEGTTLELKPKTLVIADDKGPQAIAGVVGGLKTGVTSSTTDIVLESAYFNPVAIRLSARAYAMRTDAAQRFERGVDPAGVYTGLQRAIQLIHSITGGTLVQVLTLQSEAYCPSPVKVQFPLSACQDNLGVDFSADLQETLLKRLGFGVNRTTESYWDLQVPSYRADVTSSIDVVEELARLQGLDCIPSVMPSVTLQPPEINKAMQRERTIQHWLSTRGYQEAITYSFIDPKLSMDFSGEKPDLVLLNPISSEMAAMRESLLPGLLTTLRHHQRNTRAPVAFFEVGRCFAGVPAEQAVQRKAVGLVAAGAMLTSAWGLPALTHDFFSLKAEAQALCKALIGDNGVLAFAPGSHPAFHPGESADLLVSGKVIGIVGALHPRLQSSMGFESPVYAFECFDLESLPESTLSCFQAFSRFPTVTRDLALLVPMPITGEQVETVIASVIQSPWIFQQTIFDVYQGKGIPLVNHKSLGVKLTLQHPDRTLTDEAVNTVIEAVLQKLNKVYGIQLRT